MSANNPFDVEDLTEEERRAERRRIAKIASGGTIPLSPLDQPPDPMFIDGVGSREFGYREQAAKAQGKTFQYTDEGEAFYPEGEVQPELIGPAAVAAALAAGGEPGPSANAAAPANAAAGFTPPPDIAPPPVDPNSVNLNPLAGVSLPDMRMQDIRGQMSGIREAMANEIPVTASADEVAQLAAAAQPGRPVVPSPGFDDAVGATADPLDALELAQALGQPQIDMPPPDVPGYDPRTDPLNIMPDLPDAEAAVASAPPPSGETSGVDLRQIGRDLLQAAGGVVTGDNPVDRFIGKHLLPDTGREFAEADREIKESIEGFADADAGGRGRKIRRFGDELLEGTGQVIGGAINDVTRPIDPILRGVRGMFDFGGGDGDAFADEVPKEITDGDGADVTVGERDAAGEQGAEENERFTTRDNSEVSDNPPPSTTSFRSDTPGVESGAETGFTSAADQALGPKLLPKDQRGPGVEVIRGMRRNFQPILDGPTTVDENGNTIGGGAVGSEIPFGQGTIDRFFNAGYSMDEAGELASQMMQNDADLIRAGAQMLVAKTNATQLLPNGLQGEDGIWREALLIIDPSVPDGIRIKELDAIVPLTKRLFMYQDKEQSEPDALGNTVAEEHTKFLVDTPQGGLRQAIVDTRAADIKALLARPGANAAFNAFLNDPAIQKLPVEDQPNAALELLRQHFDKSREQ